jgi:hypothetical protein
MPEYGDGLTPERRAEVAKMLGLDGPITPRYDDLPKAMDPVDSAKRANHRKALKLLDSIASAAFMRYLPDRLQIDKTLDARVWRDGYSFAATTRTDMPLPVNQKITAATGITSFPCEKNWYNLLAQKIMLYYDYYGARGISPCLVFRSRGEKTKMGRYYGAAFNIAAMVGVLFKLDRKPKDGQTLADSMGAMGALHSADLQAENRVMPVGNLGFPGDKDLGQLKNPTEERNLIVAP